MMDAAEEGRRYMGCDVLSGLFKGGSYQISHDVSPMLLVLGDVQ